MNKKTINTLIASAVALTIAGGAGHAAARENSMEQCYGVAKAGMNDCASLDGAHACAGQAAVDGDPNEWIALPAGTCEKLVNGKAAELNMDELTHEHADEEHDHGDDGEEE